MKMMPPSMVIEVRMLTRLATRKTRSAKSRGGRIGSLARRSWTTQSAKSTTAAIASPAISGESQPASLPPMVVTKRTQHTAAQKTQRQVRWSTKRPPRTGPMTLATAKVLAI